MLRARQAQCAAASRPLSINYYQHVSFSFNAPARGSSLLLCAVWMSLMIAGTGLRVQAQPRVVGAAADQAATLTGRVMLPATQRTQRTYRGSRYRRRRRRSGTQQTSATGPAFEDVVVSAYPLSGVAPTAPLPEPARVIQEGAAFVPHVTPVTVGSTVEFVNEDPFYHNVFSLTKGARFNIGRRPTGDVVAQKVGRVTVTELGEIDLFCDIHPSMNAVILSLDTPYFARADAEGQYRLTGLPPGRYEIRLYHPAAGVVQQAVTLEAGAVVQRDFSFSN